MSEEAKNTVPETCLLYTSVRVYSHSCSNHASGAAASTAASKGRSAAAAILQDSVKPHVFLGGEQYLLDWPQLDGKVGDILTPVSYTHLGARS